MDFLSIFNLFYCKSERRSGLLILKNAMDYLSLLLRVMLFFLVLWGGGWTGIAFGINDYCDPYLEHDTVNAYGYRMRDDRCEGIYIREVSSSILRIASFTESFEDYDLNLSKDIMIEWNKSPGENVVRLRAQGLKRRLYYRMDTIRPAGNTSFAWSTAILTALKLQQKDIGAVGFTNYSVGNTDRDVYIPLRIKQKGNPAQNGNYKLVLLPGVELKEVFLSVAPVGIDGRLKTFIKDSDALGYGFYPADRGIEVSISGLKEPGIYYVGIGAILGSAGSYSLELWFYHAGN